MEMLVFSIVCILMWSPNIRACTISAYEGEYCWEAAFNLEAFQRVSDEHNAHSVRLGLLAWMHMLDESPLRPLYIPRRRVLHRFTKGVLERPIQDTILFYKKLGHELAKAGSLHASVTITGNFLVTMKGTPIFKEYLEWRKTKCPQLFAYMYNFCNFLRKMPYEDENFHAIALRDWRAVEEENTNHSFSPVLLADLRLVLKSLIGEFPKIQSGTFQPKHGPGSVCERTRNPYKKLELLGVPTGVRRSLLSPVHTNVHWNNNVFSSFMDTESPYQGVNYALVKFVYKDMFTARTICMEPASYMFWQQAVMEAMYSHIQRKLKPYIPLTDQSVNAERARIGSTDGSIDTIDLSHASDSMHIDLIRAVFPRRLLWYLLGTRTSQVKLPDGEIISVKKFAPMGSAVCFPTQSLLFLGITVLAMLYFRKKGSFSSRDVHAILHETSFEPLAIPTVYGDDIVCDSRVTPILFRLLSLFGFTVNKDKSFSSHQCFRESCGAFFWNGNDVTPILFRVKRFSGTFDAKSYASMIDLINRMGDARYTKVRKFLIHVIRSRRAWKSRFLYKGTVPVPFTNNRERMGIFTTRLHGMNNHLRIRSYEGGYKPKGDSQPWYQTDEVRALILKGKTTYMRSGLSSDGYGLHIQWKRGDDIKYDEFVRPADKISLDAQLAVRWIHRRSFT